ncbi:Ribosome assembly protein 1 [Zancudomyces culisetae]|uniref:Ribosome assembly protein 1 n=1 Tax=Zancudomyces culisetae TaxID=1213189 RepID=A0A1R1PXZ3_ZANCU|nr:Ribosome assembly protein 1 [Zancudomyces culisetae]|eukprot:OMH85836.1 Ribosome assembly protein 1 [Zancudomyces culisetae]
MISTQRKSIVKERIQMTAEQMRAMGRRQRVENKAERQDVEEKGEEKEQEEEKEDENEEIMMGIGRVISGTVVSGEEVWLVTAQESRKMEIKSLYLVMGNEYIAVEKVSAGNIFGIGGVETYIDVEQEINRQEYVMVKLPANDNLEDKEEEKEKEKEKETANKVANYLQSTLAGSKSAQSSVAVVAPPIVTVSLEPIDISQYDQLRVGLERLEMADKSVRVEHHHSSGEYLLSATGELHLQRCVKDLTERFAKCQIHVGEPSVPFRETITSLPAIVSQQHLSADSDAGSKQFGLGTATVSTPNNHVTLSFTLEPLPETVVDYLTTSAVSSSQPQSQASLSFKHKAQTVQSMLASSNHSSRLLAFGPNSAPPPTNVLLASPSALDSLAGLSTGSDLLLQALATAFQLATSAGPLCAEPMVGICVSISSITSSTDSSFSTSALSGQLITLFRDAIKSSFLTYSPRLMLATYRVNIQAPLASVGKVYPVILRRKGRILSEDILDYSPDIFCISASLPVIESFGLVDEIRSKTSGDALPQLFFSGFDPLDLDPFWVPTTIDELEDLGTVADKANLAKYYMDLVRTKKGLFVSDRKIVSSAEKQRTLKK